LACDVKRVRPVRYLLFFNFFSFDAKFFEHVDEFMLFGHPSGADPARKFLGCLQGQPSQLWLLAHDPFSDRLNQGLRPFGLEEARDLPLLRRICADYELLLVRLPLFNHYNLLF